MRRRSAAKSAGTAAAPARVDPTRVGDMGQVVLMVVHYLFSCEACQAGVIAVFHA